MSGITTSEKSVGDCMKGVQSNNINRLCEEGELKMKTKCDTKLVLFYCQWFSRAVKPSPRSHANTGIPFIEERDGHQNSLRSANVAREDDSLMGKPSMQHKSPWRSGIAGKLGQEADKLMPPETQAESCLPGCTTCTSPWGGDAVKIRENGIILCNELGQHS